MIDSMDINNKVSSTKKKLGLDDMSPVDIFSLVMQIPRLTLVLYPLGENISGACYRQKMSAVIVINSSMSLGRQRFTLAHELYHYYYDQEEAAIICHTGLGSGDENEQMADCFASFFLLPPAALYECIQNCRASHKRLMERDIISIEQRFGISHQAMLFRLKECNAISYETAESLKTGVLYKARRLGFDDSLYKSADESHRRMVYGYYLQKSDELLNADIISNGKYEEYLLDAFREDIVYGVETDEG